MDAQAIWVAAQQPHIKPVPVKTERQQACMSLHGMRRQLMKIRIMQTNALRGILAEFGIALPVGHNQLLKTIHGELAKAQQEDQLPADLVVSVQEQLKRIDALQEDIDHLGQRLRAMICEDRQMQAIRLNKQAPDQRALEHQAGKRLTTTVLKENLQEAK